MRHVQDDVPSFDDAQAFAIMEEELGRPLAAVFSSISEHPIAAASLGQVCNLNPIAQTAQHRYNPEPSKGSSSL